MEHTPEELELLSRQVAALRYIEGGVVECECGNSFNILDMYRCLYCDIYRCVECSETHFGCTVSNWRKS